MQSRAHSFLATIYKVWIMRHVDVPEDVATSLIAEIRRVGAAKTSARTKGAPPKHIPVIATVNHKSVQTTLVPAGAGHYRLTLNTALRKAGRADTGEVIGVTLTYDPNSREIETPPEYLAALKRNALAKKEFDRLPPGHKRQLLAYYQKTKSDKARTNAIEKTIDHLRERALLRTTPAPRKPTSAAARTAKPPKK
jgi:Bacteriocin-protection, YdeI or OmpD-Associated/Domain of unknown function (DUF1905)